MIILQGQETPDNRIKRSQVFQATHNGEGQSLPFMNRSFISFTYGGKKIEDFDLIATVSGDRMERNGYAYFEDTVTTYDNLDGQHYWATHYKTNQLDFNLSTDGIDEKKLNEFLYWFKAGVHRELILAEHPNRAIMARVANPPSLNVIPFEQEVSIIISGESYTTKTTLYRGDIKLSLVMDQPHWYGITNILGKKTSAGGRLRYEDTWHDVTTNQDVNIFASQDALKILYEDGIPLGSMINKNMLLGNGAYASVETSDISVIWSPDTQIGARIDDNTGAYGIIAGAIVDASDNGITSLDKNVSAFFFYSGTAPSPATITFTLTPQIDNSTYYIITPKNSHTDTKYNTFTIESLHQQQLRITTPNLYTSYNKCIEIFTNITDVNTWEDVRAKLRDQVRHPAARAWAIKCVEEASSDNITSNVKTSLKSHMSQFLKDQTNDHNIFSATFTFNSETGEAIGSFKYRKPSTSSVSDWNNFGTILTDQEEDIGDMLRSNYIIIQDRNYPTDSGRIEGWSSTSDKTKQYSHRIIHDFDVPLSNIQILYKNMYL